MEEREGRSRIFNREKFLPKEDLVKQIMDMGICRYDMSSSHVVVFDITITIAIVVFSVVIIIIVMLIVV